MTHLRPKVVLPAVLVAMAAIAPTARAKVPDLALSHFPSVLCVSPDGSLDYTVHVVYPTGASYADDFVQILFSPEASALISWGPDTDPASVVAPTDEDGYAVFHLRAGGCVRPEDVPGAEFVAQVRVNNIVVAEVPVASPDAVDAAGLLPGEAGAPTCDDGVFGVSLADASFHAPAITVGAVSPCTKLTEPFDAPVGLADAAILSDFIRGGAEAACP